jgi:hypothetical protein
MDNRRIWPEIVLAGFLHLTWVVFIILDLIGVSVSALPGFFKSLQTGGAALLGSTLLGASYLLGLLTNRILVDFSQLISKFFNKRSFTDYELLKAMKDRSPYFMAAWEGRSAHKALFRSAMCSSPLITFSLLPWACHHQNSAIFSITMVLGLAATLLFLLAFCTQRNFLDSLEQGAKRLQNENGQE